MISLSTVYILHRSGRCDMAVTLEILNAEKIFLMRSGRNHKVYGDPYTFSAVWLVNGPYAEIIGGYEIGRASCRERV